MVYRKRYEFWADMPNERFEFIFTAALNGKSRGAKSLLNVNVYSNLNEKFSVINCMKIGGFGFG